MASELESGKPSVTIELTEQQLAALSDEDKAIYQMLSEKDKQFFAKNFSPADLPKALQKKGEIIKRNQSQRKRLSAIQQNITQAQNEYKQTSPPLNALGLGGIAAGTAAAIGIGAITKTISTDGTATWKGVSPRLIADALERNFDTKSTDAEVEGEDNELTVTIYLCPPNENTYVPALSVLLVQVDDTLQVSATNLTSQSVFEAAKLGGKKLIDLAVKGFVFWQRRHGIFVQDAINLAQSALSSAFDAAQMMRDLDLEDRVWQVIKETADAREKAYLIEAERNRLARLDLEKAWDDYVNCPRCGEPYRQDDELCRICGRARNSMPTTADPRTS